MELSDARYSGTAVTKEVAITYGGRELREGTDYTVAYRDNVAAGTAEISVTFTSPLKYGAGRKREICAVHGEAARRHAGTAGG